MPLAATDGWIQKRARGSPIVAQCQYLTTWLRKRPEVQEALPGAWVDAWYDVEVDAIARQNALANPGSGVSAIVRRGMAAIARSEADGWGRFEQLPKNLDHSNVCPKARPS